MTRLGEKEGKKKKGVMGRGGGDGKYLSTLMKTFQNVSHLVPEFRSLPEMNTEECGAVFEAARVIMQDTWTGIYVLVDLISFVEVQKVWFKRSKFALQTLGKKVPSLGGGRLVLQQN